MKRWGWIRQWSWQNQTPFVASVVSILTIWTEKLAIQDIDSTYVEHRTLPIINGSDSNQIFQEDSSKVGQCFQTPWWSNSSSFCLNRRSEIDFLTWMWYCKFGPVCPPKGAVLNFFSANLGRLLKAAEFTLSIYILRIFCVVLFW